MKRLLSLRFLPLILLLATTQLQAQQLLSPTTDDYGKWHNLGQVSMSDDGAWLVWSVTMQQNNDTLWVRSSSGGDAKPYAFASQASFSGDSKWLAMRIGVSYAEQEKLTEQKKTIEYALGLVRLSTGEMEKIKGITSF